MQFIVSSTALLGRLQSISKAISAKPTIPILDHFLFNLQDGKITVTASDLESTMITELEAESSEGNGAVALEAKRLLDILREFPEQPLTFEIDEDLLQTDIISENGKFSVLGAPADDFPKEVELDEEKKNTVALQAGVLETGIVKTLFATADDELRPVMNGIFVQLNQEHTTFVASDAHKLVTYRRTDAKAQSESSFILPKKPAALLKNILPQMDEEVSIEFDGKNAFFILPGYKLISRLTEGRYPNYESVIPEGNENKLIVNRVNLFNTIKRVSVFSSVASNLIKLHITDGELTISAQDIDFSISAYEKIPCRYEGEEMEIGFKSVFLNEIVSNVSSEEVILELADPGKPGLVFPFSKEVEEEDELMLLMPMML